MKLGELKVDDEQITGLGFFFTKMKILHIFLELWPFENLGILNLSAIYLKNYLS